MDNKVTLPPISDIFTRKDPFAHYAVPVYPHQYVSPGYSHAAAAASAPYHTPAYSLYGSEPYGPGVPLVLASWPGMPGVSPRSASGPLPAPVSQNSLLAAMNSRRPSVQLPMSRARSPASGSLSPHSEARTLEQPSRARPRNNLPKETTYILLKWLSNHLNHPYPNSFEKTQLMLTTGLNQQQLSNWFINARRRKIKLLRHKQKAAE